VPAPPHDAILAGRIGEIETALARLD